MTTPDVEALLAQVQSQQDEVLRLQHSLAEQEITAGSRDDEVRVRLLGSGRFTAVDIDERALRRYGPHELGEIIVEAINAGLTALQQTSQAKFAPLMERAAELSAGDD